MQVAMALVRAGLGQMDRVVESLQRADEAHDVHLVLVVADPKWDGLRGHAGIAQIIERCGFDKQPRPDPRPSV